MEIKGRQAARSEQTCRTLLDAGLLEPQPIDPLAHILLGALGEAALVIAQAGDVQSTRIAVGASLDRLLRGLRPSSS